MNPLLKGLDKSIPHVKEAEGYPPWEF